MAENRLTKTEKIIATGYLALDWPSLFVDGSLSEEETRGWLTKFIAPDGTLTAAGAHEFCYRKGLPKPWKTALKELAEGADTTGDADTFRWLVRTRLVTSEGVVTALGKLKLVESRKLSEQCAYLQLPLEVVAMKKDSQRSTEGYAILHLQPRFPEHLIVHDEHVSVDTVLYACLLAHHGELDEYLSPQARFRIEDRRYLIGFDLWDFNVDTIEGVCLKIMETSDIDFERGFALAVDLHNEAQQSLAARGLFRGLDFYRKLFDGYGKALLCDLARMRVTQPFLSFPDLCILGSDGVSFVEVKAKDKLSFNQIYTFELLKELKARHGQIQQLGVIKVDLS